MRTVFWTDAIADEDEAFDGSWAEPSEGEPDEEAATDAERSTDSAIDLKAEPPAQSPQLHDVRGLSAELSLASRDPRIRALCQERRREMEHRALWCRLWLNQCVCVASHP